MRCVHVILQVSRVFWVGNWIVCLLANEAGPWVNKGSKYEEVTPAVKHRLIACFFEKRNFRKISFIHRIWFKERFLSFKETSRILDETLDCILILKKMFKTKFKNI